MTYPTFKQFSSYLIAGLLGCLLVPLNSVAQQFYPNSDRFTSTSLNGNWKIKVFPSDKGSENNGNWLSPSFSEAGWQDTKVPGNWENQGLKKPEYGKDLSAFTGLYRKKFSYQPEWEGRRVILRLEGVSYSYEVFVNGKKAGQWGSAYNACNFDITDFVVKNKTNLICLKVSTRSAENQPANSWQFDTNDDWSLSGIFRDVTLFSVDSVYLSDIHFNSQVLQTNNASVAITVKTGSFADFNKNKYLVEATLSNPLNDHILDFKAPITEDSMEIRFKDTVLNPRLWTAETPNLYQLKVKIVSKEGAVIQRSTQLVGLRDVKVDGFSLKVNGRAITLHGACLSEIDPLSGRARSYEEIKKQLSMMKAANINFIRTAHYPFSETFFTLCDQMGFYVDAEVPFGYGDKNLNKIEYLPELLKRAAATIRDNKNHPAIILWSIGNENPYTPVVEKVIEYVKKADPSRPRGLPQRGSDYLRLQGKQSPNVSVYMAHYLDVNSLNKSLKTIDKPVILTEYAHSMGLAMDEFEAQYANILNRPKIIGGSVWAWTDQAVMTDGKNKISGTEKQLEKGADNSLPQSSKVEQGVWLDKYHYLDNFGNNGTDGIVYATGYPQEDFYVLRKVYAPVQILTDSLKATSNQKNSFQIQIENRFDFKPLEGYSVHWQLASLKKVLASGKQYLHATAKSKERLPVTVDIPASVPFGELSLRLQIMDPDGLEINEKNIAILANQNKTDYRALLLNTPSKRKMQDPVRISLDKNGTLHLSTQGKQLVSSPLLMRVGRKLTITTENQTIKEHYNWTPYLLRPSVKQFSKQKTSAGVLYKITGDWISDSTKNNHRGLSGEITMLVRANNTVELNYRMTPFKEATGSLLECGLSVLVDKDFTTFRWLGMGPFSSTTGKTAHNERRLWALDKNDIRFDGNRGSTDIAALSTNNGRHLGVWSSSRNIGLENIEGKILISQNEIITGYGSKFKAPRGKKPVQKIGKIKGSLILSLDDLRQSDTPLNQIFDFNKTVNPEQPFLKSYQW